jgi:CheY-like chemotaxis protein
MRSVPTQQPRFPAVVLLVDDNSDGVLARRSVLVELGYGVLTARNGADALATAASSKIDLIITDFKMEGMNGLELIAALRSEGCKCPIIMLTGFAEALGLRPDTTGADIVIQKSATELSSLLRHAKRLLQPPRKPASSHRSLAARAKKSGSSAE